MSALTTTIKDGFSPRERGLIAAMLALILGVAIWYGGIRPLKRAESAARARLVQTTRDHGRVIARVAQIKALPNGARQREAAPGGAAFLPWLSQSAIEAGFAPERQDRIGASRVAIAASGVTTASALGWVQRLERAGVRIEAWTLRPDAQGSLSITATVDEPR